MNYSLKVYLFHYWMNQHPLMNLLYNSKTNTFKFKIPYECGGRVHACQTDGTQRV